MSHIKVVPTGADQRVLYALRRAYQAAGAAKAERPGLTAADLARALGVIPQNVPGSSIG